MFTLIKLKIQIFGRFLSNMIMPNISIFIAWGVITSFFAPLGWYPNTDLSCLITPMMFYLLPVLIGYTGGRLISGERGGLVASITVIGVITSTKMPMFLGAMIAGPLAGWSIKYFDKMIENRIKNGFEMLVNNFSIAIIGVILSIFSFFVIGPVVKFLSSFLESMIKTIVYYHLLPLTAIVIEPAKIFFLNNAINHGIFSPLGIQEIVEKNSSVFFLIESNPGPGFGVLMAWYMFGKGNLSKSAGGAAIIELLGGIHEIYFPYVLIKPKLILALILGGMTGIFTLTFFHGGLISAISPGSILSVLAMTPRGLYYANCLSVFCSFLVSFIISIILLKIPFKNYMKKNIIYKSHNNVNHIKIDNDINFDHICFNNITSIIVACDAGMGSSAMGASILRKKIQNANLTHISISNMAIHLLPTHADLIITHKHLTPSARIYSPHSQHVSLTTFINPMFYDGLIKELIKNTPILHEDVVINNKFFKKPSAHLFQLSSKNIFLNQFANNKEAAIIFIGQKLVEQGYVQSNYVNAMLAREKMHSTWLGESIALPHGTIEAKDSILKTGIIFCQFPEGVHFGEEDDDIAYIVIGIAARNNEHMMVVSHITNALDDPDVIKMLSTTKNVEEVLSCLSDKDV